MAERRSHLLKDSDELEDNDGRAVHAPRALDDQLERNDGDDKPSLPPRALGERLEPNVDSKKEYERVFQFALHHSPRSRHDVPAGTPRWKGFRRRPAQRGGTPESERCGFV